MEETTPAVQESPAPATNDASTMQSNSGVTVNSIGSTIGKVVGKVFTLIFILVKKVVTILGKFFKDLTFQSQIVFFVILVLSIFIAFIVGFHFGQNDIKSELKNGGFNYEKLID